MDYILTVAVSISSAVAQVASAFPVVHGHAVAVAIALVALVMILNLRGVRESGVVVAVPTFFFVAMMGLTVGRGSSATSSDAPPALRPAAPRRGAGRGVAFFLVLHAFSSGTTALTGSRPSRTGSRLQGAAQPQRGITLL